MENAIVRLERLATSKWSEKEKAWFEGLKSDLQTLKYRIEKFEQSIDSWGSKERLEEISEGTFKVSLGQFVVDFEKAAGGLRAYYNEVVDTKNKDYVWASSRRADVIGAKDKIEKVLAEEDVDTIRRLYMSAWRELSSSDEGKVVAREMEHTLNSVLKLGLVEKAKEQATYFLQRLNQIKEE